MRWSATGVHPKLGENQTLALRADPPRRASVNERGGTDVLVPGYLYHFALDAKAAGGALMTTARAVVDALRPFDNTLDPQRLAEQASSSKQPLSLITLRQSDHDRVAGAIGALPGVVITPQAELLPTDETFAPAIINEVKKAVVDELDGQAGWRVVSVNQNGVDVDVLNEVPGAPGAVGDDQPGPGGAERRPERRQHHRQAGDDRGDQAVHRRDPRRRAERRRRRAGTTRHHRPLPAGVDVQDDHGGRGHRT